MGRVIAWGDNSYGQCDVPDGLIATQVASWGEYSLAIRPDGSVVAWGDDYSYGQCDVPDGLIATQVAGGGLHALAIRPDGSVVAWGDNSCGQCDVPDGLIATQVAAGFQHSLAIRPDGSVVAWGRNHFRQCVVPGGLIATQVAAGWHTSFALSADGSVVAWGEYQGYTSTQYILPDGLTAMQLAPNKEMDVINVLASNGTVISWDCASHTRVDFFPPDLIATQVAGGGIHALAIRPDGSVVACGDNSYGQCDVPDGLIATQVAGGGFHALAIETSSRSSPRRRRAAWMNMERPAIL